MSFLESVLLGLVQGVTEFLPVSSSGHLAVLEHLWKLPLESRLPLTTMLHGATVLVTIVFFFPQIVSIVTGLWASDSSRRRASWSMVFFIVIATIPAALVAVLLRHAVEESFANPMHVGLMFLVTGVILFATRYARPKGRGGWFRALLVGVAQAISALSRGISRSGATISTGHVSGDGTRAAFDFSFLLAIPRYWEPSCWNSQARERVVACSRDVSGGRHAGGIHFRWPPIPAAESGAQPEAALVRVLLLGCRAGGHSVSPLVSS